MSDIVNTPEEITEKNIIDANVIDANVIDASVIDANVIDASVIDANQRMQSISVDVDSNSESVPTRETESKVEPESKVETESKDILVDIVNLTLQQMFENFLNQNKEELEKYSIKLNPDLQKYCLEFCKENPAFFSEIEDSFKLIILDNTINTNDIPELLKIVMKLYELMKTKNISSYDPYEMIEIILHVLFMLYIQTNKKYDMESANQSIDQIVQIIKVAIELLKMPQIKIMKKSCFSCLFKK